MIYTGIMWRKVRDFFIFKDISELGVLEGNWSRYSSSGSSGSRFSDNIIRSDVGIEMDYGSKGFLVTSDISNNEKKEPVVLGIDSTGRKNSRKMMF